MAMGLEPGAASSLAMMPWEAIMAQNAQGEPSVTRWKPCAAGSLLMASRSVERPPPATSWAAEPDSLTNPLAVGLLGLAPARGRS
jgi:hypothetical protein